MHDLINVNGQRKSFMKQGNNDTTLSSWTHIETLHNSKRCSIKLMKHHENHTFYLRMELPTMNVMANSTVVTCLLLYFIQN